MALGNIRIIMTSAFTKMFDSEGVVPNDVRPLRQTTHGSIQGYFMESDGTLAEVYEAVPYAEPPTGLLRFEKTKELKSWNGTRDCGRNHMIQCVQFGDDFSGTEDCLYATIVLPHNDMKTGRRYPILIWLHGGSFQTGSANIIPIEAMVKNFASNDIVLISINYRLGPLGFLTASHRDLHGNYGLDDQIKAIEWIRANARNFDADPNNIIVGGMGAGAACASILAISPKTKGLFNGVILRSGSVLAPWAVQSVSTEDYSAQLIDYCGCSYNQTLGMAHTVECLKNVPIIKLQNGWRQIVKLTSTITGNGNFILGSTYFTPVSDPFRIEASILPGDPENVLIHNSRMPILIGVTNQEAAQWMSEFPVSSGRYLENGDWDLSHVIPPFFYANYKQVQKAVEYRYLSDYPQNVNDSERRDAVISIISDQHFVAPAVREALHYAYKNLTVYAYIFEYESAHLLKFIRKKGIKKGASHGNDCSLIFDNQNLSNSMLQKVAWNDNDRKVLDHLITQMTNFIHKRNLSKIGFVRFSPLHRAATKINTAGNIVSPVDFYSNVTVFWYETIPIVEQLSVEPHYRLLLKSCTMCQYPYKAPFYIILIALILITIGLLIACIHQQKRVKYKPTTYAIMHELRTVKNDEKLVMS